MTVIWEAMRLVGVVVEKSAVSRSIIPFFVYARIESANCGNSFSHGALGSSILMRLSIMIKEIFSL